MKSVFLILVLSSLATASAQSDSTKYGFLPALGYTSDLGLIGGGVINRYRYTDGYRPFRDMQMASVLVTTRGFFALNLTHERTSRSTKTSIKSIRSQFMGYANRTRELSWFGVGSDSEFDASTYESNGYYFESINAGVIYRGRLPLYRTGYPGAQLDALIIGQIGYDLPLNEDPTRRFWQDRPVGADGGWATVAGVGLQWENRDNEFSPIRGNKAFVEAKFVPKLVPDSYQLFMLNAEASQYVPIRVGHLFVLAGRVGLQHASGDVPYWFMPSLGSDLNVRGLAMNRYRGDGALWYNSEIRTWVYENRNEALKVGLHLFRDGGGVTVGHRYSEIPSNLTHTWGVGFALSMFTPDFIVRGDYGIGEELNRFYMGIGYTF
jgi:hypothetical protein